jgi:hypothetical protein
MLCTCNVEGVGTGIGAGCSTGDREIEHVTGGSAHGRAGRSLMATTCGYGPVTDARRFRVVIVAGAAARSLSWTAAYASQW